MTLATDASVHPARETTAPEQSESFREFAKSFSYGCRTDLLFKFLKNLPEAKAAEFFRELLEKLGQTLDDGDLERLAEHVYSWNVRGYAQETNDRWQYDTGPLVRPTKRLAESRLALLTTTGHFVEGDDPEPLGVRGMTQAEAIPRIREFVKAEPVLSVIPSNTPSSQLRSRQPGVDIRAYLQDPNVAFPLDRLREFVREGVIGELAGESFSFVGTSALMPVLKKHAPRWVEQLQAHQVDAVLLVPV